MQPFAFWQCLSLKTDKMSHYFLVKRLVCNQNKYMLFYYLLQQKKCISCHGNGDCWRLRRSRHFTYISIDWCVAIAFNFNKKSFFFNHSSFACRTLVKSVVCETLYQKPTHLKDVSLTSFVKKIDLSVTPLFHFNLRIMILLK